MDYVKKQHYISRYALKWFLNRSEKIDAVLLYPPELRLKRISSSINDICTERDFYEAKDANGQYINRNHAEKQFAKYEAEVALHVEKLIKITSRDDAPKVIKNMIVTGEWEHLTVFLMFHMALVLIRSIRVKDIVYRHNDLPFAVKQLFYKLFLFGKTDAAELAEYLFTPDEMPVINQVLQKDDHQVVDGGINVLMNHLVNNYFLEVYQSPPDAKYYFSDSPVIVNDIRGIDYFMPVSSKFALAMKKIEKETMNTMILPMYSKQTVEKINMVIVKNADRVAIVENMTESDYQFIKNTLSHIE